MDAQTEMIMDAIGTLRDESRRGFDGLSARLDLLNGRTRKAEQSIAVHDEMMATLQHPSGQAAVNWRSGKVVGAATVGVAGVLYAAISLARDVIAFIGTK